MAEIKKAEGFIDWLDQRLAIKLLGRVLLSEYWIPKIEKNIKRDKEVTKTLEKAGWTVLRFWEKEIKNNTQLCADIIEKMINK